MSRGERERSGPAVPPVAEPEAPVGHGEGEEEEPALPGTLFVLMLFLAGMAGLWGAVYWLLLTR